MENIPKHIVLFPDGNRRWAKNKGIASFDGHKKGYENLIDFAGILLAGAKMRG